MIKRDSIQRYILSPEDDGQGGNAAPGQEAKETIRAHVSVNTTFNDIQFGYKERMLLHVVTATELDESVNARYKYSERMFKVMRQVKNGNEYFSILYEVNE